MHADKAMSAGGENYLTGLDLKRVRDHRKKGHPWGATLNLDRIRRSAPAEEDKIDDVQILPELEKQAYMSAYACAMSTPKMGIQSFGMFFVGRFLSFRR